ncbi:MAG: sulfite exporter TauE/SafE family protein [Chloroflexota bacterium]
MNFLVIPIIFLAMFIQSLAGFGSALIAMPMLIALLGPDAARPAFALMGQTAGILFLLKYRDDWKFVDIRMALVGTLVGIPIGAWIAGVLSEDAFMLLLGIIVLAYAIYALVGFTLPEMHTRWSSVFGAFSGILHSAYNVGGPPLVMYATTQDWQARRFKGNLQAIFFLMGFFVIATHVIEGRMSDVVFQNYLLMVPTMMVALWCGFRVEKYIAQPIFRKVVLGLLVCIGLSLIYGVLQPV